MSARSILRRFTIPKAAIVHTRLTHDVHRHAMSLLVDASKSGRVPDEVLRDLRDFVVAELRYHHESEDRLVWPFLESANPAAREELPQLSADHLRLDGALELLGRVVIGPSGDRSALAQAARVANDAVDQHLSHEERVLMPLLAAHMADSFWVKLHRQILSAAPTDHAYLMVGLLDQLGTPNQVAEMLTALPAPARPPVAEMRRRARLTLTALEAVG